MPRYLFILSLLFFCGRILHSADGEVRFKSKPYRPHDAVNNTTTYSPKDYTPTSTSCSIGNPLSKQNEEPHWKLLNPNISKPEAPKMYVEKNAESSPYTVQKRISVPTIKADPSMIPDHKPFNHSDNKIADTPYSPSDKPREKNPLLKPRQGIKESE